MSLLQCHCELDVVVDPYRVGGATHRILLVVRRRHMSGGVDDEIKKSNALGDTIQNLVVARGQCPSGEHNALLMGYWSIAFEFHRGIICLLSHRFYGAAFALVRPLIEATVRAHVAIMGSAEDVKKLHADEY